MTLTQNEQFFVTQYAACKTDKARLDVTLEASRFWSMPADEVNDFLNGEAQRQTRLPQVEPLTIPGSPEPLPPFTLDGGSMDKETRHQGRLF